jgi:hypothetical protein
MKKFIVYSDVVKIFNEEKDLVKYLATQKSKRTWSGGKIVSKLDLIEIETCEIEVLEESIASKYLESYVEKQKRETKLNSIFGDTLSQNFEKFKTMFLELAKDDMNKRKFLTQLEITPVEKKSISKLISGWVSYLFLLNDSVEWFKILIALHNFRKINDSYVTEVFYSNGSSRYQNIKISESTKENFYKAKSLNNF